MTDYDKIEYQKLLGEYIGSLRGICCWDIPKDLKELLIEKIKKYENHNNKN